MSYQNLLKVFGIFLFTFIIFSCSENAPPEPQLSNKEIVQRMSKDGDIGIDALEYGTMEKTEYVFHHYVANGEFGIMPTEYRQLAGTSGNPARIQKLNELKSKWGFNYIAAVAGVYDNIQAIVNAGYPISTNYMACGFATGGAGDRATVQNLNNGLPSSTYFWGYYWDEPYSHTDFPHVPQSDFKSFRDFVKGLRPNSFFGFGETNYYTANFYTHNPYRWYLEYFINYYPAQVDFVMCTRYAGYYNENDQRDLWTELSSLYGTTFKRTWISANLDGGEFNDLLGHARNKGAAPWLYQMEDATDLSDQMIASYCNSAWLQDYLERYDEEYDVWYVCVLNHTHDPNAPEECVWQEDSRIYQGIVHR